MFKYTITDNTTCKLLGYVTASTEQAALLRYRVATQTPHSVDLTASRTADEDLH